MKQLHFRIDESMYQRLTDYANKTRRSIQDCMNEALVNMTESESSAVQEHKFKFIDLFAGIGGMRLAFQNNGGRCVFSSEWDKYCQKTYYANFGEMPVGDIRSVDEKNIPDHDILVAGFPCQPFSIAGVSKKNSLGRETGFLDKTQGTLFFDVVRIINEKRPKAFLLENVKNLKSHDKGNTWKVIESTLKELDYEVFYDILDGQDFVPQHRERIFIAGFDKRIYGKDIKFSFEFNKPEKKPVLRDILMENVDPKYTLSNGLWGYLQEYAEKHRLKGNGFGYGMPEMDGITRTLSARYYKDGSEILIRQNGRNPRKLMPRECARLQGYPEEFKIVVSDTQAYKQFGNSVVVPLITQIAGCIVSKIEQLEKNKVVSMENHSDGMAELLYIAK
ncbi:MAG: DNA (cytosine-5-)-methyltransferase [Lachnospiraceae bacterium]|jgi:DNA (cytosine-5)-methyltransferase 1|nr:DNA (cytosine-5-)-methyltransferase [Lachnospiraceae bacterium]GFI18045.1 DNA-cytosine methyltransferase [Lachnospiraceae bacterium]